MTGMTTRAAWAAFALAVGTHALVAARGEIVQERDGRGALAVVRRDGIMFPFASFNRNSWRITWPIDVRTETLPVTVKAVPERWWGTESPEHWRVKLTTGEERAIEPRSLVLFPIFCSKRLGLRTTYQSSQPAPPGLPNPFPKDGLAITGDVAIDAIESVDPASSEWAALTSVFITEFDNVEEATLRGVRTATRWEHPIPRRERNKMPLRIESWYRSPAGEPGWTVSYVEAVRQYPPGPEDKGCGLETLVSGWVHHQDGMLKPGSSLRGKITYCDRVGASYMLPLGRIRPSDRWYWVFQLSGYDDEWYEVAEVGKQKVRHVIEVRAGGVTGCF
jgi:hypothetical protein